MRVFNPPLSRGPKASTTSTLRRPLMSTPHGKADTAKGANNCCPSLAFSSGHFSPVTDWVIWGGGGGMRDDSAEILFQSFLQEALVSSSGMDRYVHCLTLWTSLPEG